jgi:hypothetical protein
VCQWIQNPIQVCRLSKYPIFFSPREELHVATPPDPTPAVSSNPSIQEAPRAPERGGSFPSERRNAERSPLCRAFPQVSPFAPADSNPLLLPAAFSRTFEIARLPNQAPNLGQKLFTYLNVRDKPALSVGRPSCFLRVSYVLLCVKGLGVLPRNALSKHPRRQSISTSRDILDCFLPSPEDYRVCFLPMRITESRAVTGARCATLARVRVRVRARLAIIRR